MSWRLRSISVCLRGSRLCLGFVNLCLATSALLLAGLALAFTTYDSLPIPKWALSHFTKQFQAQGLQVSWSQISADLSGGIVIEQLQLTDPQSDNPVFSCDFLYADFDLWSALRGNPFALDSLFLQTGTLYPHPQLSLSGTEAPLTILQNVHLRFNPRSIRLESALLSVDTHRISLNGSIPLNPAAESSSPSTPFHWQNQWINLTEHINALQSALSAAPHTNAQLHCSIGPDQSLIASATFSAPEISLPHDITLHHALIEIPPFNLNPAALSLPENLSISVASAQVHSIGDHPLFLRNIRGHLSGQPFAFNQNLSLPQSLKLHIANLSYNDLHPHTLNSQLNLPSLLSEPRFSFTTQLEGLLIQSNAQVQLHQSSALADLSIQGDISSIFSIPSLHLEELANQTQFSPDFTLSGSLQFKTGYTFESANLNLIARQFSTRETTYDEVYSPIKITPAQLYFGPIAVYDPYHQSTQGYYIQDLQTLDYRILAQGNIFPRRINSLLPPFYSALWETIDPGNIPDDTTRASVPPVHADVDVRCRWHTPLTQSFFAIEGQNIAYKDQPTQNVFLRIWQANGFVDILDLKTSTASGALDGQIAWIYPQSPEDPAEITQLQLHSSLPLPLLGTVFGPDIADLSSAFHLDSPPDISIQGELKTLTNGFQEKNLHIEASVDAPLTAYQIPLDHLKIQADLSHDRLHLHDLALGFHQGLITGNASLTLGTQNKQPLNLNIAISNATYSESLKTLEHLISGTPPAPTLEFEEPNGRLNLQLNAHGNVGQWDSFLGSGSIHIQDAQLAKIRLFGGLSKAFEEFNLPITSFHLNRLDSNLILHPGELYFYDLTVAGPAGRIEAPGTIYLPDGSIDFNAKVFFLGSNESGSVGDLFGTLISPLAHAFELKLKGSLVDPNWTFKNNPLQLFNPIWKAGSLLFPTPQKSKNAPANPASKNE